MDNGSDTQLSLLRRPERHSNLITCVEKSFADPKYADLQIHCAERVWHVHQLVICGQCPFFEKPCSDEFKEGKSNTINLEDDDPVVVHEMLRYLYTGDFHDEPALSKTGDTDLALVMDVLIHSISDKKSAPYDIPDLSRLAYHKFCIRTAGEWASTGFAKAIEELYTGPGHGKEEMRRRAVTIAAKHAKALFKMDSSSEFRTVARSVPEFAAELSAEIVQDKMEPEMSRYRCPNPHCEKTITMQTIVRTYPNTIRWCNYCSHRNEQATWIERKIPSDY